MQTEFVKLRVKIAKTTVHLSLHLMYFRFQPDVFSLPVSLQLIIRSVNFEDEITLCFIFLVSGQA